MKHEPEQTLLRAAWIAPMDGAVLRDAAVVFAGGRVVAVGDAGALRKRHAGATEVDLGNALVLPGLVNAHTHLELTDRVAGASPTGSFADWILGIRGTTPRNAEEVARAAALATQRGIAECLRF